MCCVLLWSWSTFDSAFNLTISKLWYKQYHLVSAKQNRPLLLCSQNCFIFSSSENCTALVWRQTWCSHQFRSLLVCCVIVCSGPLISRLRISSHSMKRNLKTFSSLPKFINLCSSQNCSELFWSAWCVLWFCFKSEDIKLVSVTDNDRLVPQVASELVKDTKGLNVAQMGIAQNLPKSIHLRFYPFKSKLVPEIVIGPRAGPHLARKFPVGVKILTWCGSDSWKKSYQTFRPKTATPVRLPRDLLTLHDCPVRSRSRPETGPRFYCDHFGEAPTTN